MSNLVQFGPLVYEKKIETWNVHGQNTKMQSDDNTSHDLLVQVSWESDKEDVKKLI